MSSYFVSLICTYLSSWFGIETGLNFSFWGAEKGFERQCKSLGNSKDLKNMYKPFAAEHANADSKKIAKIVIFSSFHLSWCCPGFFLEWKCVEVGAVLVFMACTLIFMDDRYIQFICILFKAIKIV